MERLLLHPERREQDQSKSGTDFVRLDLCGHSLNPIYASPLRGRGTSSFFKPRPAIEHAIFSVVVFELGGASPRSTRHQGLLMRQLMVFQWLL